MPKVATIRNYLPSRLLRRLRNFGEGCGSTARSTSWAILTTASAGARCGKCSNGVNVNALNPGRKGGSRRELRRAQHQRVDRSRLISELQFSLSSPSTNLNSCGAISRRWATRTR